MVLQRKLAKDFKKVALICRNLFFKSQKWKFEKFWIFSANSNSKLLKPNDIFFCQRSGNLTSNFDPLSWLRKFKFAQISNCLTGFFGFWTLFSCPSICSFYTFRRIFQIFASNPETCQVLEINQYFSCKRSVKSATLTATLLIWFLFSFLSKYYAERLNLFSLNLFPLNGFSWYVSECCN